MPAYYETHEPPHCPTCECGMQKVIPTSGHYSDCAVHSEPAYPKGECNCGACDEFRKLRAALSAARREVEAWKQATNEFCQGGSEAAGLIIDRVAELLAQEGGKQHVNVGTLGHMDRGKTALIAALAKVSEQPQYRDPTIEDARELISYSCAMNAEQLSQALCKFNFYRKVQP